MAKKIDRKLNGVDTVEKEFGDFLENGGEVRGTIRGTTGSGGHRFVEHTGVFNSRNAKLSLESSNTNGYPAIALVSRDIDNDNNSNGLIYLLGTGKAGDLYKDNYFRPWKTGNNSSTNNLGSPAFPFDEIHLKGISKNVTGYTKLPNGMILQWGQVTQSGSSITKWETFHAFPISFTTNCFSITINTRTFNGSTIVTNNSAAHTVSKAQFKLTGNASSSTSTIIEWMAIGY